MKRASLLSLSAVVAGLVAVPMSTALAADGQPAPSAPSKAPAATHAEVIVLHATNTKTGIDPKIGKMPELAKPPFSSYDSYKLLERSEVTLAKEAPTTTKLPTGELMITMKDEIAPTKAGEPKKYAVSASIRKEGGKSFLPLLEFTAKPGDIFFVAGQKYEGGVLVIGIKILP